VAIAFTLIAIDPPAQSPIATLSGSHPCFSAGSASAAFLTALLLGFQSLFMSPDNFFYGAWTLHPAASAAHQAVLGFGNVGSHLSRAALVLGRPCSHGGVANHTTETI
jgi:hypothetical protein